MTGVQTCALPILFSRLSPRSTVANSSAAQLITRLRRQIMSLWGLAEVVCNLMDLVALFKCQSVLLVLLPAVDGAAIGVYTRGIDSATWAAALADCAMPAGLPLSHR